MLPQTPNVYQARAIQSRRRNARIDAKLAAEFAQRQAALAAKLDAIVEANKAAQEAQALWESGSALGWPSMPSLEELGIEIPAAMTSEIVEVFDDAYAHGRDDANAGKPMRDGQYAQLTLMHEYLIGYREAMATIELVDDLADVEFWRTGC